MKKNNILLALSIATISFVSCKKETITTTPAEQATPVAPNERLLLATNASASTSYDFGYNADKTLQYYSWGAGAAKAEFTYQPNKVIVNMIVNNAKVYEYTYDLVKGIVQQTTTKDIANNVSYLTKYSYNAQGQMIKTEYFTNGQLTESSSKTYDANGDMVLNENKDANGVVKSNTVYEYDLSLLDKSYSWGQWNASGTGTMFPKISKHLMIKQSVNGSNPHVYKHSYTVDAQGFVTKHFIKDAADVVLETITNTWQ